MGDKKEKCQFCTCEAIYQDESFYYCDDCMKDMPSYHKTYCEEFDKIIKE